jgi:4-hydroxybenzoate polyprenyltransferase
MKAWLQLVRAPAALTVLGDTVAGAAAAGKPLRGKRLALPLSSVALYWSGMALNDWADRELDAVERPERPIPSGRISPEQALAAAGALSLSGLCLAAFAGGRDALRVAVPLTAAIWAYDVKLKSTSAGPSAMALCRALDVTLGAGAGRWKSALTPAAVLAGHTFGVTAVSRGEVHGGSPASARLALAGTVSSAVVAGTGRMSAPSHRLAATVFALGYGGFVGSAQLAASRDPSAAAVRKATVAGIHGMVPLQAGLAARRGSVLGAVLVACALPLARRLSRRNSPT